MFMGDDREAGLGLGDQGCGASVAARQAPEKESFMATEHSDYHVDAHMSDRGHISGTPLFGGGRVRGPAPHPRRCACPVSVSGA